MIGNDTAEWTAERVARLERLLVDPRRLTTQQIANELGGVSRSSVIGKVSRLGLRLPNHGLRNPWRLWIPKPEVEQGTAGRPAAGRGSRPKAKHIAFLDLEPHHCRWPYGRRLPFTFCGCDRVAYSPYCAIHTGESREQTEQPTTSP